MDLLALVVVEVSRAQAAAVELILRLLTAMWLPRAALAVLVLAVPLVAVAQTSQSAAAMWKPAAAGAVLVLAVVPLMDLVPMLLFREMLR